ncbi:MAG: nucleotidyl transferase AbiEii/AbiGii toxin family protein [Pyrinomonadaceae bacterium]
MTATEVFESVTNGGSTDFALLVQILNQHGPWCLVGGLAVNCYVEPVFTVDADIVVAAAELPAIKTKLTARGFDVTEHEHSVNAQMKDSGLRIQFTVDPRYQDFLIDTEVKTVLGELVSVASLPNIVRGKVWAWSDPKRRLSKRKKDELDLIRIAEKYPELRQLMPPAITDQLEA